MLRYLLIVLFSIAITNASAQDDSLFAVRKGKVWAVKHILEPRETIHMLANRFFISEGIIEYANDPDDIKNMKTGTAIYIPVSKDNYYTAKPTLDVSKIRELYYHVAPKDEIGVLSNYAGITKTEMRTWNNLHGNTLQVDQVLFIGWVKMMPKDSTDPMSIAAYPQPKKKKAIVSDTVKVPVPGGLDTIYNRQTNNGTNVLTEKGTAVFFEKASKGGPYIAFHNSMPRNTIIKVYNPGSGKTIYVKVLGALPDTKLYANSIIGICDGAKEALGVTDSKAWCELSYIQN